jgi:hypothetical protein
MKIKSKFINMIHILMIVAFLLRIIKTQLVKMFNKMTNETKVIIK